MNRDRIVDINRVLLEFKEIILKNPSETNDLFIGSRIYGKIIRANTPYKNNDSEKFDYWVDNNKRENTEVVVTYDHPNFCQFLSQNEKLNDFNKHHKIYLSLKPEYLQQGVEILFDFLDKEKIPHSSKVARFSRDDQIVVRVGSHEDCEKIVDFISKNEYIQEGKKKANPFSFQEKGVALATDGGVSYNTGVSYLVEAYLREYLDKAEEIGINTFIDFCVNYYNKYFVNKEDNRKIYEDFRVENDIGYLYEIVDYKYCIKLFLNSLEDSFNLNKFEDLIDEKGERFATEMANFKYTIDKTEYMELFDELCEVMINKYGYDQGSEQIIEFIYSSDESYITRDHNLRKRVSNSDFVYFIKKHAESNNMTIEGLINKSINKSSFNIYSDDNSELFKKGVNATYDYHQKLFESGLDRYPGIDYARGAVVKFLRDNSYKGFTREDNTRDTIKSKIDREEAYRIVCSELGIRKEDIDDIFEVAERYLNKVLSHEREMSL